MKTHCLLGVVLSSGDTAVDAKRRVPGALELALRRGQANQPADWRPCQMALTAVSESNAGEGEGVQGGEEDDISQLARGVLPPNMLERYPKEEGASYPCLGDLQTAGGHVQGPWGQKAAGLQGSVGCAPSAARGTVPRTGTLRTRTRQKGGGRERRWGQGSASPGRARGSHWVGESRGERTSLPPV